MLAVCFIVFSQLAYGAAQQQLPPCTGIPVSFCPFAPGAGTSQPLMQAGDVKCNQFWAISTGGIVGQCKMRLADSGQFKKTQCGLRINDVNGQLQTAKCKPTEEDVANMYFEWVDYNCQIKAGKVGDDGSQQYWKEEYKLSCINAQGTNECDGMTAPTINAEDPSDEQCTEAAEKVAALRNPPASPPAPAKKDSIEVASALDVSKSNTVLVAGSVLSLVTLLSWLRYRYYANKHTDYESLVDEL